MQDVQKGRSLVQSAFDRVEPSNAFKSPLPTLPKGKGGDLARGAYPEVRERDKGPRTQLAAFFNILLDK